MSSDLKVSAPAAQPPVTSYAQVPPPSLIASWLVLNSSPPLAANELLSASKRLPRYPSLRCATGCCIQCRIQRCPLPDTTWCSSHLLLGRSCDPLAGYEVQQSNPYVYDPQQPQMYNVVSCLLEHAGSSDGLVEHQLRAIRACSPASHGLRPGEGARDVKLSLSPRSLPRPPPCTAPG